MIANHESTDTLPAEASPLTDASARRAAAHAELRELQAALRRQHREGSYVLPSGRYA